MRLSTSRVELTGVRCVVPSTRVRFDEEIDQYGDDIERTLKLKALMGYDERRLAPRGVTTVDLAEFAVRSLVDDGLLDPQEVDALILVTQTPDYQIPPSSSVLHGRLSLREDAYVVDINSGCAGYIMGLAQAAMLLEAGCAKKVLLVVGDTLSHKTSAKDRNSYPLIGDAAAVTVLSASESARPIHLELHNRGRGYEALMIPAGGARLPASNQTRELHDQSDGNFRTLEQLVMKGGDVFSFTQTVVPKFITTLVERSGHSISAIEYFFLHQANSFILTKIAERLKIPLDRVPHGVVSKYGNSSSATVPVAMADTLRDGYRPATALLCGFGGGLAWGGAIVDLRSTAFLDIVEHGG
jgi:3-oxoacyl-[acyl-carrier-protein] synthase-3